VAGNVLSFENCGEREVSYWIGREYCVKGFDTETLSEFLVYVEVRCPLQMDVVRR
jgi:hypothetical protein